VSSVCTAGMPKYKRETEIDLVTILYDSGVHEGTSNLDVATGDGTVPWLLQGNAVALDISKNVLRDAKKGCVAPGPWTRRTDWICGDARLLPFRPNSFDFVTIFAGLMFIQE